MRKLATVLSHGRKEIELDITETALGSPVVPLRVGESKLATFDDNNSWLIPCELKVDDIVGNSVVERRGGLMHKVNLALPCSPIGTPAVTLRDLIPEKDGLTFLTGCRSESALRCAPSSRIPVADSSSLPFVPLIFSGFYRTEHRFTSQ